MKTLESISVIAALNIGSTPRATLILVLLGLKPTAYVDVYTNNNTPQFVKRILKDSGLFFAELSDQKIGKHLCGLTVAKTQELADNLKNAHEVKNHSSIGFLLGYPHSAVLAFGRVDEQVRNREYPSDMDNNPLGFKLSLAGKDKEVELIYSWMAAIKMHAPKLFEELYSHMPEVMQPVK